MVFIKEFETDKQAVFEWRKRELAESHEEHELWKMAIQANKPLRTFIFNPVDIPLPLLDVSFISPSAQRVGVTYKKIKTFLELYKSPDGFLPWHLFSKTVAFHCFANELERVTMWERKTAIKNADAFAKFKNSVNAIHSLVANQFPVRFCTEDAARFVDENFQEKLIPANHIPDLFPGVVLFFPRLAPTKGQDSANAAIILKYPKGDSYILCVVLVTETADNIPIVFHPRYYDASQGFIEARGFLDRIIFGLLRLEAMRQSNVERLPSGIPRADKSPAPAKQQYPLPCVWITGDFGRTGTTEDKGGTHASPTPHWRKGHWHKVRYGKQKQQLRLKWYPSVFVNASQEENP